MPIIRIQLRIAASRETCFDLARDIDFHVRAAGHTGERAIGRRTGGLIGMGERVTFEAKHLGFRQKLTSEITAFDRPSHFRDSMISGAFRRFDHDHCFTIDGEYTVMEDVFDYEAPFGVLGRVADVLFLQRYMTDFLRVRALAIRQAAEGGDLYPASTS